MNKKRLLELADVLEHGRMPDGFGFHMDWPLVTIKPRDKETNDIVPYDNRNAPQDHWCGTVGCIAGLAVTLWPQEHDNPRQSHVMQNAQVILGLSDSIAAALFAPTNIYYDTVTPPIAGAVVRFLAETGTVIWPDDIKVTKVHA